MLARNCGVGAGKWDGAELAMMIRLEKIEQEGERPISSAVIMFDGGRGCPSCCVIVL